MLLRFAMSLGLVVVASSIAAAQLSASHLYSAFQGAAWTPAGLAAGPIGVGIGALVVALSRSLAGEERSVRVGATAFAASSFLFVLMAIALFQIPPVSAEDATATRWAALAFASLAPFIVVGVGVAAIASGPGSRLGLLGVGWGLGLVLSLLGLELGAHRLALVAAAGLASGSLLLGIVSRATGHPANLEVVLALVFGTWAMVAGDFGEPWLKPTQVQDLPGKRIYHQAWSSASLLTVERESSGMAQLRRDGRAHASLIKARGRVPSNPSEIAYILHDDPEARVLVIGAGGGRDIRAAVDSLKTDVEAIEMDPGVVDLVSVRYKNFTGALYEREGVRVHVDDARRFLRTTSGAYDHIVLAPDGGTDDGLVGPLAARTRSLYTTQGFADALRALSDDGTVAVRVPEADVGLVYGLSVAALESLGTQAAGEHLFGCSFKGTAVLFVKRSPYDADERQTLERQCTIKRFEPLREITPVHPAALPIDDRPFLLRSRSRLAGLLSQPSALRAEDPVLFAPFAASALGLVLLLLGLVIPRVARPAHFRDAAESRPGVSALLSPALAGAAAVLGVVALCMWLSVWAGSARSGSVALLAAVGLGAGFGLWSGRHAVSVATSMVLAALGLMAVGIVASLEAIPAVALPSPMVRWAVAAGALGALGWATGRGVGRALGAYAHGPFVAWMVAMCAFGAAAGLGGAFVVVLSLGFAATTVVAAWLFLGAAIFGKRIAG